MIFFLLCLLGAAPSKTPNGTYTFSAADHKALLRDLNSPSASTRIRAINAIKTPKGRYSMFDVAYEKESVTEEEKAMETQKARTIQEVMKPVVAYVEVRSGMEDRSEGIKQILRTLGAQVNNNLLKTTTHVIFKGGKLSTYKKARSMNVPIVSVLWVEACKKHLILASTKDYPISNLEKYENSEIFGPPPRTRTLPVAIDLDSTPTNAEETAKPLVFRTPMADQIRREMNEIRKKQEETDRKIEEEKARNDIEKTPVAPQPQPQMVKAVTEPPLPQKKKSPSNTTQLIANAMKHLKNLTSSPPKKTSPAITAITEVVDLTESPEVNLKQVTAPNTNRRRTLFTPNPAYEVTPVAAPQTDSKTTRRKTIFTPTSTTTSTKDRRRTLFTPQPQQVIDRLPIIKSATKSAISSTPLNRRRTLLPNPLPDTPRPRFGGATPHAREPTTPKTVIRKRKIEPELLKENTPPRARKTLMAADLYKQKGIHVELKTPPIQVALEAKRRRTLFTPQAK